MKVIIPEDSGLSYNEAFRFTTELHGKYDYYTRGRTRSPAAPDTPSESQ